MRVPGPSLNLTSAPLRGAPESKSRTSTTSEVGIMAPVPTATMTRYEVPSPNCEPSRLRMRRKNSSFAAKVCSTTICRPRARAVPSRMGAALGFASRSLFRYSSITGLLFGPGAMRASVAASPAGALNRTQSSSLFWWKLCPWTEFTGSHWAVSKVSSDSHASGIPIRSTKPIRGDT